MFHANLLGRLIRWVAPVPKVISTAQNSEEGGRLRERLYRWTDRWADRTTQVSAAGARRYVERGLVAPEKIAVVPNSVDAGRFAPDPSARAALRAELGLGETFTWLAVGHLEPQKDYPTLLWALAMGPEAADSIVLVAGHGSQRDRLAALADELGVARQVRWLGLRRDVSKLLNAADGFVMSSAWEGTPLAMLEAAATGLPVVATDVGGNAEVVVDGEGGWIVPAGDPPALAAGMARILALGSGERRAMGQAARRRVLERYTLAATVDRWEGLYDGAEEENPSPGGD
jgi:glycosyltransferase involved in cell wall biosynthesis